MHKKEKRIKTNIGMLVFLCIVILVLTVLAMHIRVGMNVYWSLFGNDGFIKVYVFGIRVFKAAIHFEHDTLRQNSLVIEHGKKKGKIHLNNDPEDKRSIAAMLRNPAFSNLLIEKISAHFTAGRTNDTFFTVALVQALRVVFYGALAPVKCRYDVQITESFTPVYDKDVLQADVIGIIGISIADIIVSYVGSFFHRAKTAGVKKQEVA